jgi:hypothetical protein
MGQLNLTDATELFKINYGKKSENVYNSANILLARMKKSYNFTGKQKTAPVPTKFVGGVGSGSLPTVNNDSVDEYTITRKKVYARAEIEREAIKAATNDEGAFVRMTKWAVQRAVESYMRNCSRILFNDSSAQSGLGNGAVAFGDGSTNVSGNGTTGTPYLVTLVSTTVEAFVEEGDFLHYDTETGSANFLEVVEYNPTTKVVSLVGTSAGLAALSGSGPVPTNKALYMQNSKAKDPTGLGEVLRATSGSLYGINVKRRWQAGTQQDASGAGITTDMMNEDILEIDRKSGKCPNLIIASYKQYRKILNLMEDKKYFDVQPRSENLVGKISFKALEYESPAGPVPLVFDRFMGDDQIFYLNDNYMEILHAPDFGWFDDDGTVFLRKSDDDAYEARYGGYWETLVMPNYQGIRYGLA